MSNAWRSRAIPIASFTDRPRSPRTVPGRLPWQTSTADGIHTNTQTHDVLLQDLWIHGHPVAASWDRSAPDPSPANDATLPITENQAGTSTTATQRPMRPGATWNFFDSIIEFSGCNQDYPDQSHAISCYSQSSGGYGDGVGTPGGTCLNANINQLRLPLQHPGRHRHLPYRYRLLRTCR